MPASAAARDAPGGAGGLELEPARAAAAQEGRYGYEEALELCGEGGYTARLAGACFVAIVAMGVDIFGLGVIATAAACDLGMTLAQVGILSAMPFAGIMVMSYWWGYVADTRGRKLALQVSAAGGFACAALSSLAPTWQALAAMRFLSSAMSSAAESATYALLGECCAPRRRARYLLLITSALMLTPTLYYVTAFYVMQLEFSADVLGLAYRPWRLLTFLMSLPLGLSAALLCRFSESPKFLCNVGRQAEALLVLRRMCADNRRAEYPVQSVHLEEAGAPAAAALSLHSLWAQLAPLFRRPLLGRTLLLYYLTFVAYITNNSFAIILPSLFNLFFTAYAAAGQAGSFCSLLQLGNGTAPARGGLGFGSGPGDCSDAGDSLLPSTVWAGCAHGVSFFLLNALVSCCARRRKALTVCVFAAAAVAALCADLTGEPLSGLLLFYVFLTTAMVFGVISSYFVDLYPTSYRGMVACVGMVVARLSAFAGTSAVSAVITEHCAGTMRVGAALALSGALAACLLPRDGAAPARPASAGRPK